MWMEFDQLPDHSRIWIFQASRALTSSESHRTLDAVNAYLEHWKAHGKPLSAGCKLVESRFLIVGADEQKAGASGCSIDALTRVIVGLNQELDIDFMQRNPVVLSDGERMIELPFQEVKSMLNTDKAAKFKLFDITLSSKGDLKNGIALPIKDSWVGKLP
jgi:hypothetical protein